MASISSLARQSLLLEFSSLKYACPEGIYVTLTPGDPSLWSGVLFVRQGPYSPSVLRFHISFSPNYPSSPPLITFSTEIFHPLLTPLTTQTYAPSTATGDEPGATEEERLPPGGFSLRHGFPRWFGRDMNTDSAPEADVPVYDLLEYLRAAFNDEAVLNSIPVEFAANPGAFHAWRAYCEERDSALLQGPASKATPKRRRPGEWNWQGVWEQRVRKGVAESLAEPALFGSANSAEEIIRFFDMDEEATRQVVDQIAQREAVAQ